jgi:hypothetical protein
MDSQHLQQATSNPNIQRVLAKQVSLQAGQAGKRMSVASSTYNTEAATAVASRVDEHPQPTSLPPQLQQPPQHQQPQQQVSLPPKQQPGMHVAPTMPPQNPPYALQPVPQGSAPIPQGSRISISEQSSRTTSHTETAV